MDRNTPNRRKKERVEADKLPEGMREFRLDFGSGEIYTGTTVDASLSSISFIVEVPPNRIREHEVRLISADGNVEMVQELVYIKPVDASHSRISLMFDSGSTPDYYRREVGKALSR